MPYDYLIFYRKGSSNSKADTLSRTLEYRLKERGAKEDDNDLGNQFKFKALDLVLANSTVATGAYLGDELGSINISSSEINKPKAEFAKKCSDLYTAEETQALGKDGSLISSIWYKNHLIRPPQALFEEIATMEHQRAHGGCDKTIEVVDRNFDIPNLWSIVEGIIKVCDYCQRTKHKRHKCYGLLNPLDCYTNEYFCIILIGRSENIVSLVKI